MSALTDTIIRWGILAGMANKEAFVSQVSAIIEKYSNDPVMADRLSRLLAAYLENRKDSITTGQVIKKFISEANVATREDVQELEQAIHKLAKEVERISNSGK